MSPLHDFRFAKDLARWQGETGWSGLAQPAWCHFEMTALPWTTLGRPGRGTGGVTCIKCTRSRHVLYVRNPARFGAGDDQPVYVKRYRIDTIRRRVGNLLSGGKARREFLLGRQLLAAGLPVAVPLAYAVASPDRIFGPAVPAGYAAPSSFLVLRAVEHRGTVAQWAQDGRGAAPYFYLSLARFLAAVHEAGFLHARCSARNLVVAGGADFRQAPTRVEALDCFHLLDVDHGRLRRPPLSLHARARNLFQAIRLLRGTGLATEAARRHFVAQYVAASRLDLMRDGDPLIDEIRNLALRRIGMPLFADRA